VLAAERVLVRVREEKEEVEKGVRGMEERLV
jgi:hypothetical protein